MDPGIPNAPNTTLAGVASLTDCKAALPAEYSIQKVVPELPLPTPAPQAISNKSLLFHPRVEEEAKNLLKTKDVKLIPQLVSSLEKTSAEHIEVKDSYSDRNFNKDGMPNLLKALLDANPQVFSGNTAFILQKHQRLLQQKQYQQQQLLKQQQTVHTQSGSSSQQLPDQHLEGQQPLPKQQLQGQQLPFEQLSSQHYPNQELPDQQLHSQNLPNQQSHEQNLPNQDLQGQHQFSDVPQNVLQQPEAQTQAIQPVLQDVEAKQETEQSQVPLLDEDPLNLQAQHQPQPNNFLLTSTIGQHLVSSTALPDQNLTLHTKPVATSVIQQSETSTQLSNSDILENKTEAVVQPNNNQKSIQAASVVTHTTTTSELRQLRRPSARGQQPAQTLTTSTTNNTPLNNAEDQSNLDLADRIKQPIIRIGRISEENQALMQKSLKQFVASKPQLAKELGIDLKQKANYKEDSDSENESRQDRKRKKVSDDEYEAGEDPMDTFSALMGKRRKMQEKGEEKPIVLSKPKLRKVERKFVPVLQKLSTEELMESNTYVRFNKSVEHVLRSADDMDFAEIVAEETIQDEYLLSRSVMHELCIEAAKLKTLGAMEMMPTERFTRLLHVLELNIRGGDRISPVSPDVSSAQADERKDAINQFFNFK